MPTLDFKTLALLAHQHAAVEMCERYFASGSARSALVHHPTGTGKTGIMATIASRRARKRPVLVVCPSIALLRQLISDFQSGFWDRIGAPRDWAPEQTLQLLPSTTDEILTRLAAANGTRTVVFSTIQALQQVHAGPGYERLQDKFGTVLFDEGHREPARAWANAARGLATTTVLFSATPYRSDLKLFDVDLDHVHFLSFRDAVTQNLIRGAEIDERDYPRGAAAFARLAIKVRDDLIARKRFGPRHKMIIRADSEGAVEDLFVAFKGALKGRQDGVLALHINFDLDGPVGCQRRSEVPSDLRARPECFLIHQHLLSEGIDDPACTMLAIYEPFPTERQLVQQIGRLTRHDGKIGRKIAPAYVLAQKGDGVARMWQRFLSFDQACIRNGGKPPIRQDATILENLVRALPEADYIAGKFRSRLDFDEVDLISELRVPKSAVAFDITQGFDLGAFDHEIAEALQDEDRFVRKSGRIAGGECRFHISLALSPSPFLADSLFLTPALELTIFARHGRRLFFYDSGGLWLDNQPERDRVTITHLRRLLPDTAQTRVTALALKNTDIGPLAIKSRSMSARSLAAAGTFVGEHLHVVTRAAGRVGERRREIAFLQSRVREGEGAKWTADEFWAWTRDVNAEMETAARAASLFSRFALPTKVPANTDPLNILIDIDEITDEFDDEDGNAAKFDYDAACVDVREVQGGPSGYTHTFDLAMTGRTARVWIRWDREKRKYWLRSEDLSALKLRENPKVSLLRRLNQRQPFRIVVGQRATIYAYGGFYDVDLDLKRTNGIGPLILNLVEGVSALRTATSEKGTLTAYAETWPPHSVFGVLDRGLSRNAREKPFGEPFSALVCDDLSDEVADFIGIDEGNAARLTFIAAKWKDGNPGVSAQAIHDVCAQVMKNLPYIKVDARPFPGSDRKWQRLWRLGRGSVARIRRGGTANAIRTVIDRCRTNPNAARTFWMVLGGGVLSRRSLERELDRDIPQPHVLQFVHLLLSCYSACQSVGADLRVFCAD